jgi:hypothetical protein
MIYELYVRGLRIGVYQDQGSAMRAFWDSYPDGAKGRIVAFEGDDRKNAKLVVELT